MKVFFKYPIPVPAGILDQHCSILNNCPALGKGKKGKKEGKAIVIDDLHLSWFLFLFSFVYFVSNQISNEMKRTNTLLNNEITNELGNDQVHKTEGG
jgi:hypothetical protein